MLTRTQKKSPDNTRKLNRLAICLKVAAPLIILLTVFAGTRRAPSTHAQVQDPVAPEPMQIERMNGNEVVSGEAIVRFKDETDEAKLQTFVENAISMVNASAHRNIAPGLNMFHIRTKSMNTPALLNRLSRLPGVMYAEANYVVHTTLTPNDTR